MPGADSCAVMEGENEGDLEDEVVYTKPSLLGKLKAIASKVSSRGKRRGKIVAAFSLPPTSAQNLNIAIIKWSWKRLHLEKRLKYREG